MTYYFLEHPKNTDNISVNFSLRKALCVIGALVTFATVFSLINILPLTSHLSQYLLQNDVVSWTHFLILTGDTSPLVQLISFAMIGVFSLLNNLNNDSNTATASLVPTMIIGLFITYFAGLTPNLMMIPLPLTWVLTQCFMSYALPKPMPSILLIHHETSQYKHLKWQDSQTNLQLKQTPVQVQHLSSISRQYQLHQITV